MVLTRKEAEKQKAASTSGEQGPARPIVHEDPPESPAMPPVEQEKSQGKSKKTSRASTSKTLRARRVAEAKEEIARRKLELAEARLEKIQAEETEDSEMSDIEQDTIAVETSRVRVEKWMDAVEPLAVKNSPRIEDEVQKIPTSAPIPTPPVKKTESAKFEVSELTTALLAAAQALTPRTAPAPVVRQLPTADLPTFNGAHTEWLNFKMAYEDLAPHGSARENTARLRRALKGRAKEEVNSLLIVAAKPEEIMRALENRFGRPHTIAQLEYEKLENIQRPTDAARDVCAFANKIQNTVAVLYALGEENYCHHPKILKGLVEKLTPALRYRWYDHRKKTDKKANLDMFKNFIIEEAESCREFAPPENILSEDTPPPPRQRPIHRANATVEKKSFENKKPAACTMCEQPSHPAYECNVFKNADSNGRWELAKEKRLCFRCLGHKSFSHRCKTKSCNENGCIKSHHRMLHYEPKQAPTTEDKSETETVAHTTRYIASTYLKIVPVRLSGATGHVDTHALLDDGSTVTLVDAHIASKIGADGPADPLSIETVSGKEKDISSRRVTLQLRGHNSKTFEVRARTIDRLHLSSQTISKTDVINAAHLRDLDSCISYEEAKPTLLIGQDNWQLLIAEEVRRGNENQPAASLTPLGWVLHGATTRSLGRQVHYVAHVTDQPAVDNIDDQMKHFFSLESLCIQPRKTRADPDELALQQLKNNTVERGEGGYETSLLWKNEVALPNNYESALKRMIATEKKIDREPQLQKKYEKNIEALIEKGYAEEAPKQSTPGRTWYLPHFAVLHPAKPEKVRVVFDAAARYAGTSLNDHLLSGPDLLQSLPGVLMRFRQHPVAVAADIQEMFLRIGIKTEDRDALRFLWRNHRREGPPQEYRMKSVVFGAACSPCIALFVKNHNAEKHREEYPEAAEAIVKHHYMDDYLQSCPTVEEAVQIATDVQRIHREANFNLCKWASNRAEIIEATSTEPRPQPTRSDVTLADVKEEKVLGLTWRPETDTLGFNLNFARTSPDIIDGQRTPTKREALTTVMSLFDPLGFASPITIQAKRLLQDTWRTGTDWDEPLHESLRERWHQWIIDLKKLEEVNLPRCHPHLTDAVDRQLHVFVDASESSYAAAAYWRVISQDGSIHVSLAAAKAKVAPLKVTSIPRLELQAAVLGSRLGRTIIEEYQVTPSHKYYWSDSKTVLAWLRAGPRAFKPFVAHRVAEIEEETTVAQWHWVPSQQNVADDATRNVPHDFAATHRWFIGPAFLYQEKDAWPQEKASKIETNTGEEKVHATVTSTANNSLSEALPKIERFSSWLRLIRTTARVLQFIDLVKIAKHQVNYKRTKHRPEKDPQWRHLATTNKKKATPTATCHTPRATPIFIELDADYTRRAEQLWIHNSQQQSFPAEIAALRANRPPPTDSRLKPLAVYIDDEQTLRLKSRIAAAADVTTSQKEPSVIDGDHPFTKLYIAWVHRQLAHSSTEAVVNEVRQQHWVLRLRPTVKQIVNSCLPCRIRRARPAAPPTGDHPYNRLGHHKKPFTFVGLDYFGPLTVTVGRRHEKRYVALFTCLTTRALHLEIAASLSSDSAVMALRRFIARRGCPAEIYSDNGTNMHGADKELREALQEESSKRAIRWRFICPSSPFMGGCWERLVKSVKTVLQRVLHERHPHEECLHTLLAEAEYIVNSRPLTHVSVDPADDEALTPNHFLIGGSARTPPAGTFDDTDLSSKADWRRAQRLADHFWARWVREYLPELQHRREPHGRGKPIAIGDIVLIADGNLPRNVWPRGIVTALHPGADGTTRVVDVQTRNGVLRRPTKKIVVLPPTDTPAPKTTTYTAASVRREICAGQTTDCK